MLKKYFTVFSLLLVAFAFWARLQTAWELFDNDSFVRSPPSVTDMATYKQLSAQIASGRFSELFYYQPFYYAAFLPFTSVLSGSQNWGMIHAQIIFSTLTVFLCIASTAMLAGRKAALIAGFLCSFSIMLIFYVPYALIETLQVFWISLLFYLLVLGLKRKRLLIWICAGVVCGLTILTRGNAWCFALPLLFFSFLPEASKPGAGIIRRLANPVLILIFMVLPQIPFSVHNSYELGKFCGPSSAGGAVLALGNTPEAPPGGRNPGEGPGPMEYPDTYNYWLADSASCPVTERIFKWLLREPFAFIELQARKLMLFWDGAEIPNNIALEFNGKKSKSLFTYGMIPTRMTLILGLAGMISILALLPSRALPLRCRRRSSSFLGQCALISFIVLFCFATAAFYNLSRFRLPVIPLLCISSGIFAVSLTRSYRLRNWRLLFLARLVPFCISVFVVSHLYAYYRSNIESAIMAFARPGGVVSELADQILIMDNGPYSFGGWDELELKESDEILKVFSIPDSIVRTYGSKKTVLKIPFVFLKPGSALFEVNGDVKEISSDAAGLHEISSELPLGSGKFSIVLLRSDAPIILLCDKQRNYGRTVFNGYKQAFELVAKLYIPKDGE